MASGGLAFFLRPGLVAAQALLGATSLLPAGIASARWGVGAIDLAGGRGLWPHLAAEALCTIGLGLAVLAAVTWRTPHGWLSRRPWLGATPRAPAVHRVRRVGGRQVSDGRRSGPDAVAAVGCRSLAPRRGPGGAGGARGDVPVRPLSRGAARLPARPARAGQRPRRVGAARHRPRARCREPGPALGRAAPPHRATGAGRSGRLPGRLPPRRHRAGGPAERRAGCGGSRRRHGLRRGRRHRGPRDRRTGRRDPRRRGGGAAGAPPRPGAATRRTPPGVRRARPPPDGRLRAAPAGRDVGSHRGRDRDPRAARAQAAALLRRHRRTRLRRRGAAAGLRRPVRRPSRPICRPAGDRRPGGRRASGSGRCTSRPGPTATPSAAATACCSRTSEPRSARSSRPCWPTAS